VRVRDADYNYSEIATFSITDALKYQSENIEAPVILEAPIGSSSQLTVTNPTTWNDYGFFVDITTPGYIIIGEIELYDENNQRILIGSLVEISPAYSEHVNTYMIQSSLYSYDQYKTIISTVPLGLVLQ
jgi:hypothetical protein